MDFNLLPKTRKEAKALNSKFYYTGKLCKNGHLAPKRTSSYSCVECDKLHNDKYSDKRKEEYQENPEKFKQASKLYYRKNRQTAKARAKAYKSRNKEYYSGLQKQRYEENKENILETNREYRLNNRAKCNALSAKYHAAKLQATPKWLSKSDYATIETFYVRARELTESTGIQYHVDHIIPLQGENVSGLHVPWNLQVITASENLAKSNKVLRGI